jgi:diacylglycerol kinase
LPFVFPPRSRRSLRWNLFLLASWRFVWRVSLTGLDAADARRYILETEWVRLVPSARRGKRQAMVILHSSTRPPVFDDVPPRSPSRRSWNERLRPACRGIKLGIRGHSRFFVHFFCTALVLAAAIVFRCDLVQWCVLLGCIGMLLSIELLNSAFLALFHGLDEESRRRAAPCLDIASGAVLLAIVTAVLLGALIFLSRLLEMCAPLFK